MKQLFIILIPMIAWAMTGHSQTDTAKASAQNKGINFEEHLTWEEILQKAKVENRYIFVDCYASWCGPCKWMDQHVYNNDTIGDFMNKAFISAKVQMDSTEHDSATVRDWYLSAHEMCVRYLISTYPTYLFFSPDGRAIHKAIGAARVQNFLALAKSAMDPLQQYYTLLAEYRGGSQQSAFMPYLASTAKKLHEDSLSCVIVVDYLHHLEELAENDLWTKDNIKFIASYANAIQYGDKIFTRYLQDSMKIDSIMGSTAYTWRLVNVVAYNEDVRPRVSAGLKDGLEPNWRLIERTIAKRYGGIFVNKNVLKGREEYYRATKKWDKYAKYFVLEMQRVDIKNLVPGLGASMAINNSAFEVFKYSKNRKELEEALSWIDKALSMTPFQAQELDTKANLLYKLGRKGEAIICEEKSHDLAPLDNEICKNYEKMKKGQPTW